jgi:hypothetical protein
MSQILSKNKSILFNHLIQRMKYLIFKKIGKIITRKVKKYNIIAILIINNHHNNNNNINNKYNNNKTINNNNYKNNTNKNYIKI